MQGKRIPACDPDEKWCLLKLANCIVLHLESGVHERAGVG